MGKQVSQGTRFESRIVTGARDNGRAASRLPKTGVKDEPDLEIRGETMYPAVAVEHWVTEPGKKRRRAVRYVVMEESTFNKILDNDKGHAVGFYIQAKSRQKVSVRSVLEGLIEWKDRK